MSRLGVFLGAGLLAATTAASTPAPWVISQPVEITSPMEQIGDVIVVSGGSLTVSGVSDPGFRLRGNLIVAGTGTARLANSVIQVESTYHGQYSVIAIDNGRLVVTGCDYRVPTGVQHAIVASGDATVTVEDTTFGFAQLIANAHGTLSAARLDGQFEVILQEPGHVVLEDIPHQAGKGALWVWPEFPPGSRAVYSPPLPGFVTSWSFPPPGGVGIAQSCELRRCEVKLWPLLVREGSNLTLSDISADNWVVVGLHLPNSVSISQLVNGRAVAYQELPLADRRLVIVNATIDTWNLYPESAATVTVQDSVIGELLASGSASVTLERTTVDGSGGYFGANTAAVIDAEDSTFTCDVQVSGSATVSLHRCHVLPYPFDATGALTHFGAFDTGRLFIHQTATATTAGAGGSGLLVFAAIADPPAHPPFLGARLDLFGTVAAFSLDPAVLPAGWRLEAQASGEASPTLLGQGQGNLVNAVLGSWSGADPFRDYTLRVVLTDAEGRTLTGPWPVARMSPVHRHLPSGH